MKGMEVYVKYSMVLGIKVKFGWHESQNISIWNKRLSD